MKTEVRFWAKAGIRGRLRGLPSNRRTAQPDDVCHASCTIIGA